MPIRSLAVMASLAKWDAFPIHRRPRPIVLTDLDKHAWLRANPGWLAALDNPGAGSVAEEDLPPSLLPAALAYCEGLGLPPGQRLAPLIRGEGPFGTDRGTRLLPAWMMFRDDRREPFIALDPDFQRDRTWSPTGRGTGRYPAATLAADRRTLTFRFLAHPGFDYPGAKVHETETALLIEPIRDRVRHVSLDLMYDHEMRLRPEPLGDRVLISTSGTPITVLTEGSSP